MHIAKLLRSLPCYIAEQKKILGLFSDEMNGKIMIEFVALKAKTYTYNIEWKEKIKAKGVRGHVVQNRITLDDHKTCLFSDDNLNRLTKTFQSHRSNFS